MTDDIKELVERLRNGGGFIDSCTFLSLGTPDFVEAADTIEHLSARETELECALHYMIHWTDPEDYPPNINRICSLLSDQKEERD